MLHYPTGREIGDGIYEHRRATRRCRPKVTRISTHGLEFKLELIGLLRSLSAMPWRLIRDLILVVSRTELTARGSCVS